jgi:hypothetical protein
MSRLNELLLERDLNGAYLEAESLRVSGTPIPIIRSQMYDTFIMYRYNDRQFAIKFAKRFESYKIKSWLDIK